MDQASGEHGDDNIFHFNPNTLLHSCLSTLNSYLYDAQLLRLLECPLVPQIQSAACILLWLLPIQFAFVSLLFVLFLHMVQIILGKFACLGII